MVQSRRVQGAGSARTEGARRATGVGADAAAAGARALAPGQRWSASRKRDVVLRLLCGGCFRHQLLLPRPYLVLTKPLRLDIQCQRGASVKIGWKYLDD